MKKIIFYLSLFSICTVHAFAQNKHAKADVWIDRFDFETNGLRTSNNQTLRGESWISLNDNNLNGESIVSRIFPIDDKEHGKVLELKYTLNQGQSKYNPYVALFCPLQANTYPSHIVYIAYDYKGPSHLFLFNTNDVKDNNHFKKEVASSKDWTTVMIPLSELKQAPGVGKQIPFNPDELNGLEWLVQGITGDTGSLMIDNIRFVYTPIEGRNYQE